MRYFSLLAMFIMACGISPTDLIESVQEKPSEEELLNPSPLEENINKDPTLEELAEKGTYCVPGEIICHGNKVDQCNDKGNVLFTVEHCSDFEVCQGGECVQRVDCTLYSCADPLHCSKTYPPCPYGIGLGDIAEDAVFMDPTTKSILALSDLYNPKSAGLIALIAANGW